MVEPKVELASISLFRATPAQIEETRRRRWPHLGGTLSLAEYITRDEEMDVLEHAQEGKMITW